MVFAVPTSTVSAPTLQTHTNISGAHDEGKPSRFPPMTQSGMASA